MDWLERELAGIVLPQRGQATDEDVATINNLPNPPLIPLTAREVHVRRCRLAGDAIDAGGGRFRTEDLPRLLEMTEGAPALIGHRRDALGVARFFGGELWRDPATDATFIVPKFYWLKAHSGSEDLRICIDGGLYSEASIGFAFQRPTCSICGEDIRRCEHFPGREYDGATCFYWYDELLRVTEGSFVYRGAQPGTGFMLSAARSFGLDLKPAPRFKWRGEWFRGVREG